MTAEQEQRFEKFLSSDPVRSRIKTSINWRARAAHNDGAHPFLSREDLQQEAYVVVYETFQKFDGKVPESDMLPLVALGLRWRMTRLYEQFVEHTGTRKKLREGKSVPVIRAALDPCPGRPSEAARPIVLRRLQKDVAATIGEPDALARLVVRERVDAAVAGMSAEDQSAFKQAVERGTAQGRKFRL